MKTVDRKLMINSKNTLLKGIKMMNRQIPLDHTTQRLMKVSIIFQNLNMIQRLLIKFVAE